MKVLTGELPGLPVLADFVVADRQFRTQLHLLGVVVDWLVVQSPEYKFAFRRGSDLHAPTSTHRVLDS